MEMKNNVNPFLWLGLNDARIYSVDWECTNNEQRK